MVMIFKDTYEDLTPERLEKIIDAFEQGKGGSIPPGPQNGRASSEPQTAQTTLIDERIILKSTRDREAKAAASAAKAAFGASVPPSRAARPKTNSIETSPAFRSPSKTKADLNGEKRASVKAPAHGQAAADQAAPEVEGTAKPRAHPRRQTLDPKQGSPELLQGKPIGPAGKRRKSETVAPEGVASPDAPRGKKPR
jgi:NADH-quinone oxidoreductase subunit E